MEPENATMSAARQLFESQRALFGRGYTASNGWFDRWPNGNYKRVETQAAWEGWIMGMDSAATYLGSVNQEGHAKAVRLLVDEKPR